MSVAGPPYKTERSEIDDNQEVVKTEFITTKTSTTQSARSDWPVANKAEESHGTSRASISQSATFFTLAAVLFMLL